MTFPEFFRVWFFESNLHNFFTRRKNGVAVEYQWNIRILNQQRVQTKVKVKEKSFYNRQQNIFLIMTENLLNTLAVTFHFGTGWQIFPCSYACNAAFSEILLFSHILQEFRYRRVREPHTQLEGSTPAFNIVVCLLVAIYCVFEETPETDWKQRFTSFTKTNKTSKPRFFEVFQISFDFLKTSRCQTNLIGAQKHVFGRNKRQRYARFYNSPIFYFPTVYFFYSKVLYFAPVGSC